MQISVWLIAVFSVLEVVLLIVLFTFFRRLRNSEQMLLKLRTAQTNFLATLEQNASLERELIASFAERQQELKQLDLRLEQRAEGLRKLLSQAEAVSRSPQFLRELILSGTRQGKSPLELAKSTGLSVDEVKLILAQATQ